MIENVETSRDCKVRITNVELRNKFKSKKRPKGRGYSKSICGNTAPTTLLTKFEWLYTKSTGVWYPKVAPGDAVREGEQIGTVGDLFGDTLEEIVSPVNGVVLFLTINPSVLENGLLMGIGAE